MTIEDIIKNDLVVHCATEEEANRILSMAHTKGLQWRDKESYFNNIAWDKYYSATCYRLKAGTYCSKTAYEIDKFTIISSTQIQSPTTECVPSPEDKELMQKRLDLASMAMQGMLVNSTDYINVSNEDMVKVAYTIADELLKQSGL